MGDNVVDIDPQVLRVAVGIERAEQIGLEAPARPVEGLAHHDQTVGQRQLAVPDAAIVS